MARTKPKTEPVFRLLPQRYEMRAVDSLRPHEQNANEGDVGAIVESIDENGFFGAVLVQESTGRILAGKHRWASAIERGAREVPSLIIECDDEAALNIMLADNETARLGRDNQNKLATVLSEIHNRRGDLKGTAHTPEKLDDLIRDLKGKANFDFLNRDGNEGDGQSTLNDAARSQNGDAKFPLSVVLTKAQSEAWKTRKEELGVRDDTRAFLMAVEL